MLSSENRLYRNSLTSPSVSGPPRFSSSTPTRSVAALPGCWAPGDGRCRTALSLEVKAELLLPYGWAACAVVRGCWLWLGGACPVRCLQGCRDQQRQRKASPCQEASWQFPPAQGGRGARCRWRIAAAGWPRLPVQAGWRHAFGVQPQSLMQQRRDGYAWTGCKSSGARLAEECTADKPRLPIASCLLPV